MSASPQGLPTAQLTDNTELVPTASARGVVRLTSRRLLGRLTDGHFVKVALKDHGTEFLFAANLEDLAWFELEQRPAAAGNSLVLGLHGGSFGILRVTVSHIIDPTAKTPEERFNRVHSGYLWDSFMAEYPGPDEVVRVRSRGTFRSRILEPSPSTVEVMQRARSSFAQPWLSLP